MMRKNPGVNKGKVPLGAGATKLMRDSDSEPSTGRMSLGPELTKGLTAEEIRELEMSIREDLDGSRFICRPPGTTSSAHHDKSRSSTSPTAGVVQEPQPAEAHPEPVDLPAVVPSASTGEKPPLALDQPPLQYSQSAGTSLLDATPATSSSAKRLLVNFYPRSGERDRSVGDPKNAGQQQDTPRGKAKTSAPIHVTPGSKLDPQLFPRVSASSSSEVASTTEDEHQLGIVEQAKRKLSLSSSSNQPAVSAATRASRSDLFAASRSLADPPPPGNSARSVTSSAGGALSTATGQQAKGATAATMMTSAATTVALAYSASLPEPRVLSEKQKALDHDYSATSANGGDRPTVADDGTLLKPKKEHHVEVGTGLSASSRNCSNSNSQQALGATYYSISTPVCSSPIRDFNKAARSRTTSGDEPCVEDAAAVTVTAPAHAGSARPSGGSLTTAVVASGSGTKPTAAGSSNLKATTVGGGSSSSTPASSSSAVNSKKNKANTVGSRAGTSGPSPQGRRQQAPPAPRGVSSGFQAHRPGAAGLKEKKHGSAGTAAGLRPTQVHHHTTPQHTHQRTKQEEGCVAETAGTGSDGSSATTAAAVAGLLEKEQLALRKKTREENAAWVDMLADLCTEVAQVREECAMMKTAHSTSAAAASALQKEAELHSQTQVEKLSARLSTVGSEMEAIRDEFFDSQTRMRELKGEIEVDVTRQKELLSERIDEVAKKFESLVEEVRQQKDEDIEKMQKVITVSSRKQTSAVQDVKKLEADLEKLKLELDKRCKQVDVSMKKEMRLHAKKLCSEALKSSLSSKSGVETPPADEKTVGVHLPDSSLDRIPSEDFATPCARHAAPPPTVERPKFLPGSRPSSGTAVSVQLQSSSSDIEGSSNANNSTTAGPGTSSESEHFLPPPGRLSESVLSQYQGAQSASELQLKRQIAAEVKKQLAQVDEKQKRKHDETAVLLTDLDRSLKKNVVSLSARIDQMSEKQKSLQKRVKFLEDASTLQASQVNRAFEVGLADFMRKMEDRLQLVLDTAQSYRRDNHKDLQEVRKELFQLQDAWASRLDLVEHKVAHLRSFSATAKAGDPAEEHDALEEEEESESDSDSQSQEVAKDSAADHLRDHEQTRGEYGAASPDDHRPRRPSYKEDTVPPFSQRRSVYNAYPGDSVSADAVNISPEKLRFPSASDGAAPDVVQKTSEPFHTPSDDEEDESATAEDSFGEVSEIRHAEEGTADSSPMLPEQADPGQYQNSRKASERRPPGEMNRAVGAGPKVTGSLRSEPVAMRGGHDTTGGRRSQ